MRRNEDTLAGRGGARFVLSFCSCAAAGALVAAAVIGGPSADADTGVAKSAPPTLDQRVNDHFGFRDSATLKVDVQAQIGEAVTTSIMLDGEMVTLDLVPHSVRADSYVVMHYGPDGTLVETDPAPVNTLRGVVREIANSKVVGGMMADGLYAKIITPGAKARWLEPIAGRVDGAKPGDYVLYASDDVIPTHHRCGNTEVLADDQLITQPAQAGAGPFECAELGCDADFEYFQDYGSIVGVQNRINLIINTVDNQYQDDVGIDHVITGIIVRDAEPDPYSSTNAGTLLGQFRSEWLANVGIPRDVAHLFTGKSLQGSTIGIAWGIGEICTDGAYCLSESDFNGVFSCATDLTAHELGHLWNGFHCSCPSFTMNPSITCANQFSSSSISSIEAHRDTRTCLQCPDPGPPNNDCEDSSPAPPGLTPFNNIEADQDGPNEPNGCNSNQSSFPTDVWFTHQAQCDGVMTIGVCDADFNTKLAVYPFGVCPPVQGSFIACDDNTCGLQTEVQFVANAGDIFYIRIGGYNGETGEGTLSIECTPVGPACPADLDDSGTVDTGDLLALLANWGGNGDGADLAPPNNIVDTADLLFLLAEWGDCP